MNIERNKPSSFGLSAGMRWLDARAYDMWQELLHAASAYAQLTGGRFLAEDFEDAPGGGRTGSRSGAAFEAARDACRPFVDTYRVLARAALEGGETTLVAEYEQAYVRTVNEAALRTMVAALKALDRYGDGDGDGDGGDGDDDDGR